MSGRSRRLRLRVDPISCDGHGHCAEMMPELIRLDEWGFPIVVADGVPPELEEWARKVARCCPRNAVRLEFHT